MVKSLAVFDLDKTILKANTSFSYYWFLLQKGFFSLSSVFVALFYFVRHVFFRLSPNALHALVFQRFLKGQKRLDVFGYVEDFLDQFFLAALNQKVLKEIDKAKKKGSYIVVLSSSPSYLVEKIVRRLNLSAFQATSYSLDTEGHFDVICSIMDGEAKARYALALAKNLGISERQISVYTDSIWDLPLLNIAGKKIVAPPDRGLCRLAKQKAWKILP